MARPLLRRFVPSMLKQLVLCLALVTLHVCAQTNSPATNTTASLSTLIEAAGHVEYMQGGTNAWQTAAVGLVLRPGDRLRTDAQSRAGVQLSDRSIIRLNQRTTLE